MLRRFSTNYALFSITLDGLLIWFALVAATRLRPELGFLPFAAEYPNVIPTPAIIYPIVVFEWLAIFMLFSVYDGRRNLRTADRFVRITVASALAAVAMAGTLYLSYRMVSRLLFISFVGMSYLLMLGWRAIAGFFFRNGRTPIARRRVLIVGAGKSGRELAAKFEAEPQFGLQVIGFMDDDGDKCEQHAVILGPLQACKDIIDDNQVDDVIIALPRGADRQIDDLVAELHQLPVNVWVIPDYFRLALHKAAIEEFAGIPLLDLKAPALTEYQRLFKRASDIAIILLTSPISCVLMGLISLGILLESQRPVLFSQERVGENGKIFKMLKFRTMVANAESLREQVEKFDEHGNLIHKSAGDPRITRLGRILRRMSLDELPQIINVIKGDMSLVGPRPELPYLVEKYEPWQRQRFVIPQGITGWWQINGRSNKPMHLNTEDDLYYIQNYSPLLDLYILIKTPVVIVRGDGAF